MDLIGPMPETPRGNKYIVTLTDYFSKWAEAAPLKDKGAVGVAKFIYSVSYSLIRRLTMYVSSAASFYFIGDVAMGVLRSLSLIRVGSL